MNKVILMGRCTRDPEVRYSQGDKPCAMARFSLAVDRRFRRENDEKTADFINCIAIGKTGEFIEKYGRKGIKFVIEGRIQTGNYTNKDGVKVYTTDVLVESVEFAESKNSNNAGEAQTETNAPAERINTPEQIADGFTNIPDGIDEELPFN